MNRPTATTFAPPRPVEVPVTQSPVRPTPPVAVEVVDGFQQISATQREHLLADLERVDCHITAESVWLRVYNPPGSSAFDRARAREQRTNGVAA